MITSPRYASWCENETDRQQYNRLIDIIKPAVDKYAYSIREDVYQDAMEEVVAKNLTGRGVKPGLVYRAAQRTATRKLSSWNGIPKSSWHDHQNASSEKKETWDWHITDLLIKFRLSMIPLEDNELDMPRRPVYLVHEPSRFDTAPITTRRTQRSIWEEQERIDSEILADPQAAEHLKVAVRKKRRNRTNKVDPGKWNNNLLKNPEGAERPAKASTFPRGDTTLQFNERWLKGTPEVIDKPPVSYALTLEQRFRLQQMEEAATAKRLAKESENVTTITNDEQ